MIGIGVVLMAALSPVAAGPADGNLDPLLSRTYDAAAGDACVVAASEAGLVTYSADGATRLGVAALPGSAVGVVLAGDVAWVALGPDGLAAVSVADPKNPRVLSRLATPASVQGVAVAGERVYLAEGNAGLAILDAKDAAAPSRVGRLGLGAYCRGVGVSGDLAVVAASGDGIIAVDVRDPARPRRIGIVQLGGVAHDVAFVREGLVLVAAGDRGAHLVDVSKPAVPAVLGAVPSRDFARGVAVRGAEAAIADGGGGVVRVSIENPNSPSVTRRVATKGQAIAVAFAADGKILAAADASGLAIVD